MKKTLLLSSLLLSMYAPLAFSNQLQALDDEILSTLDGISSLPSTTISSYKSLYGLNDLQELNDEQLSKTDGQALLSLGYTAPTGTGTGSTTSDYGFYKLGMEAKIELNTNIRSLQLGCGGVNGAGGCDIEMENVAISGPADGKLANGTPVWSKGRPSTSAQITNPFLEFAIKNPNNAATREVVGFRASAEELLGHLSAGTSNVANPTDGIKTFSGYIQVASIPANAFTDPAIFGAAVDQAIYGQIETLCLPFIGCTERTVSTYVNGMTVGNQYYNEPTQNNTNFYQYNGTRIWGIHVPKQTVSFQFPQTTVQGTRMSQLNLVVRDVPIPRIPIGRESGGIRLIMDQSVLGLAEDAIFFMGTNDAAGSVGSCATNYAPANCTYLTNLKANVDVKQNFNLVHNLPLASGGYLSLQQAQVKWPGTNADDTAQRGWWMSFKDPLNLGALNPTTGIPMADVMPQMADFITNNLSSNVINLGLGDALNAVFGAPVYKSLGNITIANDARAVMSLENLLLDGHQTPVSNCWGNLKFC